MDKILLEKIHKLQQEAKELKNEMVRLQNEYGKCENAFWKSVINDMVGDSITIVDERDIPVLTVHKDSDLSDKQFYRSFTIPFSQRQQDWLRQNLHHGDELLDVYYYIKENVMAMINEYFQQPIKVQLNGKYSFHFEDDFITPIENADTLVVSDLLYEIFATPTTQFPYYPKIYIYNAKKLEGEPFELPISLIGKGVAARIYILPTNNPYSFILCDELLQMMPEIKKWYEQTERRISEMQKVVAKKLFIFY